MKKLILTIIAAVALCASVHSQTNPPPIVIDTNNIEGRTFTQVIDFLSRSTTNWLVAPYGIYDQAAGDFGAGLAVAYKLNDFVVPTLRIDELNGNFSMVSGSLQLQMPIKLGQSALLTPFVFGGTATPLSGAGSDNGTLQGIFGAGMALRFGQHFGVVADYEKWTGHDGQEIRFGPYWKF